MANFLSNDESIQGKWGPPPKLDAAPIGGVLEAILKNKLGERALTQSTISAAIKAEQARRQQDAYAEALRNTGLSEGQDLSELNDADSTRIAQLLQARTPDDKRDALLAAQTKEANARAGMYDKYGTGGGADDSEPETYTDENNVTWRKHYDAKGRVNWYPIKSPTAAKPQTQGDLKSELANTGVDVEGINKSSEQKGFLPSGAPVPAGRPWTDASTIYVPAASGNGQVPLTIEKFRHLKKALGIPDPDPTPMPSPTPGATPGQTPSGSPIPTATPTIPQTRTAADTNVAPGYGVSPPRQHIDALRQDPNPKTKAYFDEVYGRGAADYYLTH